MLDTQHTDWLKQRKVLLTASDIAAVLGESPFKGGIDVYLDKVDPKVKDEEYVRHLAYGHDVEEAIAKAYSHETGRAFENPGDFYVHVHPDIPWLGASLDRITWPVDDKEHKDSGALECKSEGGYRKQKKDCPVCNGSGGVDEPCKRCWGAGIIEIPPKSPDDWQDDPHSWQIIQLQTQMQCARFQWGSLAAMFPGYDLRYVDQERDDELFETIFPILEEFWGYVQRKEPPPLKFQETKKLAAMKRLWNRENGETIPLNHEQMKIVDKWEAAKETLTATKSLKEDLEAQVFEMLGAASFGAMPDGTMLIKKIVNKKEYTTHHKATSYPQLRRKRV